MISPSQDFPNYTSEKLLESIEDAAAAANPQLGGLLRACGHALRREREKSQRFLDTVEAIIVGLDPSGIVTVVNRRGCELLGYRERELLGRPWLATCLPQGSDDVHEAFRRIMSGELKALDYYENEVLTRSGDRRMVAWYNNYMRDSYGAIIGTLSCGEDITARKLVEERNKQLLAENRRLMQRQFEVQETERRHLARELHDELGQWLSAMQAHARLIADLAGDELLDIRESAAEIMESIDAVLQNVRRMICDLRPVTLDALGLQDSLDELVTRWQTYHPAISCKLEVSGRLDDLVEPLNITIYRIIQEALTNISNHSDAREATINIRRVASAEPLQALVLVTVADDGRGMRPDVRNQGMGLLGMRERVLAAGGTFEVESSPGQGVRINIRLPVATDGAIDGHGGSKV